VVLVAGADACRGGWAVIVAEDGRFVESLLAVSFAEVLAGLRDVAAIAVDIPIGLPEVGARAADVAARAFVGPRRSSVFPAPTRAAVRATSYGQARAALPSLSAQSFALAKKILEVERCLNERIFEVHPEVSFRALAGRPLDYSKRSWNGHTERRRLLRRGGLRLPDRLTAGLAAPDDILDAAVAAWSAGRIAGGEAQTLPPDPPIRRGRRVAIWY
jgi:predicted RNase H-like nuclease